MGASGRGSVRFTAFVRPKGGWRGVEGGVEAKLSGERQITNIQSEIPNNVTSGAACNVSPPSLRWQDSSSR